MTQRAECPFCTPDPDREYLVETARAYALRDRYPVSEGHTLVIPKQHTAQYFHLSDADRAACWHLVQHVHDVLEEQLAPEGFNIGINVGEAAGQTVDHVHIHIIPRYAGDVEDPTGGVRNVIPGKGNYVQ